MTGFYTYPCSTPLSISLSFDGQYFGMRSDDFNMGKLSAESTYVRPIPLRENWGRAFDFCATGIVLEASSAWIPTQASRQILRSLATYSLSPVSSRSGERVMLNTDRDGLKGTQHSIMPGRELGSRQALTTSEMSDGLVLLRVMEPSARCKVSSYGIQNMFTLQRPSWTTIVVVKC